jgi:sigma-E factor negative regulatory protein RseA
MMTNVEELKNRAQVSDLMDGRLRGEAFSEAVALAAVSEDARNTWLANHVIGDVLRFGDATGAAGGAQFADRFRARLAQEPTPPLMAPELSDGSDMLTAAVSNRGNTVSANNANFRWKMVAGVASFVAVAALGWLTLTSLGGPDTAPQLAQTGTVESQKSDNQVMIRDPHLDALLAAHKQFGGTSALQMPAGFLRNATFESPSR